MTGPLFIRTRRERRDPFDQQWTADEIAAAIARGVPAYVFDRARGLLPPFVRNDGTYPPTVTYPTTGDDMATKRKTTTITPTGDASELARKEIESLTPTELAQMSGAKHGETIASLIEARMVIVALVEALGDFVGEKRGTPAAGALELGRDWLRRHEE